MSLSISIRNPLTGDERSMNWLRNPFGLCQWAEDNYEYRTKQRPPEHEQLSHVCNAWSYSKCEQIHRPLFKRVVENYWEVLAGLECGYYFFNATMLIVHVVPNWHFLPLVSSWSSIRPEGMVTFGDRVGIPVEHFAHSSFHLPNASLARCKAWYEELLEFAELLQDRDYEFYCSN